MTDINEIRQGLEGTTDGTGKMEKIDHILEMILLDDSPMDAAGHADADQAKRAITLAKVRLMKRWSLFYGGGDYRMIEQPERGEYVKYEDAASIINSLADELLCMSEALHSGDSLLSRLEEAERQRDEARAALEAQGERMSDEHIFILVEALSEIKATVDGESDQPVKDIVYGCLAEIEALPVPARALAKEQT